MTYIYIFLLRDNSIILESHVITRSSCLLICNTMITEWLWNFQKTCHTRYNAIAIFRKIQDYFIFLATRNASFHRGESFQGGCYTRHFVRNLSLEVLGKVVSCTEPSDFHPQGWFSLET